LSGVRIARRGFGFFGRMVRLQGTASLPGRLPAEQARFRVRSRPTENVMTDTTAPTISSTPVSNGKTALTDAFRTHFSGDAPLTEKAKGFAKERPWTSAMLLGVAALGVLGTLRGSSR
jgi:hypothetical protein